MDSQSASEVESRTVIEFLSSIKGLVKMLRLILIVATLVIYVLTQAPEPYIVITALESISALFFIVLYILRLDLVWKCLFWPLLDVINSLMTVVFLMIVSVLALVPETDLIAAIGGILGIVATVLTIGDAALIYRKLMFNPSGPFEKKHSHDKKRRSRHSRHSHHSHHSYEPQPSLEKK
ncbi:chemokine-like factor isoform X1 [Trichosurus vulpecula]|uniref:chemokine-like factor isoform X1 n=1 Tax=Trichosurus vulpecula TaxID=9337 RepID=UPI00186AEFBD|nr:chemokine-like factor isoform X1 [Trichosurus vulpecula]